MHRTRLILIEGMPGSGKTSSANYLATYLRARRVPVRCYTELDRDNPIPLIEEDDPVQIGAWLAAWRRLARQAAEKVLIVESRWWQNSAMNLYMSTCCSKPVRCLNAEAAHIVAPLKPLMIYLSHDDPEAALRRLAAMRGTMWMQMSFAATCDYPWFNGAMGFEPWLDFFTAWFTLSDEMFEQLPFARLRVNNPHSDWPTARRCMREAVDEHVLRWQMPQESLWEPLINAQKTPSAG